MGLAVGIGIWVVPTQGGAFFGTWDRLPINFGTTSQLEQGEPQMTKRNI